MHFDPIVSIMSLLTRGGNRIQNKQSFVVGSKFFKYMGGEVAFGTSISPLSAWVDQVSTKN